MDYDTIAILDAGSQFTKLFDRILSKLEVNRVILPLSTPAKLLKEKGYKAIIVTGGPSSVTENDFAAFDKQLLTDNIPILGVCYGMQLFVSLYGGVVDNTGSNSRDGPVSVTVDTECPLFQGVPETTQVLVTHKDVCTGIPEVFNVVARSRGDIVCGISHKTSHFYGLQFHPEVPLTTHGFLMIKNFVLNVAKCRPCYKMECRLASTLNDIRNSVAQFNEDYNVLILLSGGVDSLVCSTLVSQVVPAEKLKLVHIDHGFMRSNESQIVYDQLQKIGLQLLVYRYEREFMMGTTVTERPQTLQPRGSLSEDDDDDNDQECIEDDNVPDPLLILSNNVKTLPTPEPKIKVSVGPLVSEKDPETKRRIIGDTFVRVSNEIMEKLGLDPEKTLIAQGTLRPDLIESASSLASTKACTIKTHHNDSHSVRLLREKGLVLEPLKDFHKDEVRELGLSLGIAPEFVYRHPFPGPGLAIRILCSDSTTYKICLQTQSMLNFATNFHSRQLFKRKNELFDKVKATLNEAELKWLDEITSDHKDAPISCHIIPLKTVGVQGDGRSYKYFVALSSENEKPNWSNLVELGKFLTKICNSINRVVYTFGGVISDKSIEKLTRCYATPPVVDLLRSADKTATDILIETGCYNNIGQMPVILIPVHFDNTNQHLLEPIKFSVVLRPVITSDFMTCLPAIPGKDLPLEVVSRMHRDISNLPRISRVLYDLTCKPPGTIEWE